jgi:hypothetical protein
MAAAKPFSGPRTPGEGTVKDLPVGSETCRGSFWLCAMSSLSKAIENNSATA